MNVIITSAKCLLVSQNSVERYIVSGSPCTILVLCIETFCCTTELSYVCLSLLLLSWSM